VHAAGRDRTGTAHRLRPGLHGAGFKVTPPPPTRSSRSTTWGLEAVGMLKIDLLGLRRSPCCTTPRAWSPIGTASRSTSNARSRRPQSLRAAASGRTAGIFQFESPLATDCLRNMKCRSLRHLSRPTPAPPRSARHGDVPRLHQSQTRPRESPHPTPRSKRFSRRPTA